MSTHTLPQHEVLVVGAGFGGIAAGVRLRRAGIDDFVIVDKHPSVGGTWFVNKYPGVAVDIPSFIYSFSFAQTGKWSRLFAPGEELQQYAEDVVDGHGLRDKLRLGTTVLGSRFDEDTDIWHVETDRGEITARHVIVGIGGLEVPNLPDIPGIGSFGGKLLHTTAWDHDYDLTGKRVAVIGTGATALQLVPAIADQVSRLTVFQRTAIWVAPKLDFKTGPVSRFVFGNRLLRAPLRGVGMALVELGLGGPCSGPAAGAAPLQDGAAGRGTCTERLDVDTAAPRSRTAQETHADLRLRVQTAFHAQRMVLDIHQAQCRLDNRAHRAHHRELCHHRRRNRARDRRLGVRHRFQGHGEGRDAAIPLPRPGRHRSQHVVGRESLPGVPGVTVPGWPNAYMLIGPWAYSPGSYLVLLESTVAHAVRAITETRCRGATRCEVRQEPHDKYWQQMLSRAAKSHLLTPLCAGSNTYYINYQGDAAAYRPSTNTEMRLQNRYFPFSDYEFTTTQARQLVAESVG